MNKIFTFCYSLFLVGMITSCVYHVEDELYPPEMCDTLNVTYSGTISPIIAHNCFDCHSLANVQVSMIPLEGYANLIVKVNDGKLINAIRHRSGASPMPKDRPSLEECDILKIEKWVAEGFPDN